MTEPDATTESRQPELVSVDTYNWGVELAARSPSFPQLVVVRFQTAVSGGEKKGPINLDLGSAPENSIVHYVKEKSGDEWVEINGLTTSNGGEPVKVKIEKSLLFGGGGERWNSFLRTVKEWGEASGVEIKTCYLGEEVVTAGKDEPVRGSFDEEKIKRGAEALGFVIEGQLSDVSPVNKLPVGEQTLKAREN